MLTKREIVSVFPAWMIIGAIVVSGFMSIMDAGLTFTLSIQDIAFYVAVGAIVGALLAALIVTAITLFLILIRARFRWLAT